jgi:hypothetical protein
MMRSAVFAAAIGLATGLWPHSGFAEGALAIGMVNGNPRNGYAMGASSDKATADEARTAALSSCRDPGPTASDKSTQRARSECKIIETFRNQCVQDAVNGNADITSTAVGWAVAPDSDTANSRAMTMCETMRRGAGRPCEPDGKPLCDGDAR